MKFALLVVILAVALAGCGGDDDYTQSPSAPAPSSQGQSESSIGLNHGAKVVTVTVDGTEMLCLERRGRQGNYESADNSGQYAGLTCDWYGWHLKKGDVK